jgi:G:T-mismatch repair DNA endonuclease (very short patch repair protein)
MTAKEIWKRDKKKYNELKRNGYKVFIIWESDNVYKKIKQYLRLIKNE